MTRAFIANSMVRGRLLKACEIVLKFNDFEGTRGTWLRRFAIESH